MSSRKSAVISFNLSAEIKRSETQLGIEMEVNRPKRTITGQDNLRPPLFSKFGFLLTSYKPDNAKRQTLYYAAHVQKWKTSSRSTQHYRILKFNMFIKMLAVPEKNLHKLYKVYILLSNIEFEWL